MAELDGLARIVGGESWALAVFAVMVLRTRVRAVPVGFAAADLARRWNGRAWTAVAVSALCYRPLHSLWLVGHAAPRAATLMADLIAVTIAIGGFITLLAARGLARGLTGARVKRGIAVNVALVVATTGVACLSR